jgi:hypothetical protein
MNSTMQNISALLQSKFCHLRHCCHQVCAVCFFLRIVGSMRLKTLATEQCANVQCLCFAAQSSETLQMSAGMYGKAGAKKSQVYEWQTFLRQAASVSDAPDDRPLWQLTKIWSVRAALCDVTSGRVSGGTRWRRNISWKHLRSSSQNVEHLWTHQWFFFFLIGLCILLRVYQSISIETSVRNKCWCTV